MAAVLLAASWAAAGFLVAGGAMARNVRGLHLNARLRPCSESEKARPQASAARNLGRSSLNLLVRGIRDALQRLLRTKRHHRR